MVKNKDLESLIQLTNQFLEYLEDLREEEKITEENYKRMVDKKIKFLNICKE